MTPDEFETEYIELLERYGQTPVEAVQKQRQAFAHLFTRSGFSSQSIIDCTGLSKGTFGLLSRFGRFLTWLDTQRYPHATLTQNRFDVAWRSAKGSVDEDAAFAQVADRLGLTKPDRENDQLTPQMARQLAARILNTCGDGTWRRLSEIATAVHHDPAHVQQICQRIVQTQAYKAWGEQRHASHAHGGVAYRLVKGGGKKVDVAVLYTEVRPVLDWMKQLVYGHAIHFSQQSMKLAYEEFRQKMERVMTPTTRSPALTRRKKDTPNVHTPQIDHPAVDPRTGPTVCHDDPLTDRTPVS